MVATPLLLTDPGTLYWAPLATALPGAGAGGTVAGSIFTDAWPVAWIPLGATEDGSEFTYSINVEKVEAAEFFDPLKWVTTERSGSFAFNLLDYTANNIKRAFNGGTLATVSGTGATTLSKYNAPAPGAEIRAMLGWESLDKTMRAITYQCINSGDIKTSFKKAPAKAALPCNFQFEVPAAGQPFDLYFAGTARVGV